MSSTPKTWAEVALQDLGTWRGGGTPSKANPAYWTDGDIPWVSAKDMKVDRLSTAEDTITRAAVEESATNVIPPGSVLVVTRSGILDHTLPVAVLTTSAAINQDLKALAPRPGLNPDFVAYALRNAADDILHTCRKEGTTVASVEFSRLMLYKIPLAPSSEQRRIVTAIEEHLTRLDVGRASLTEQRAKLGAYRAAVLRAACEGHLLAPEGRIKPIRLGEIASIGTGCTPLRTDNRYWTNGDVPWVTSGAVRHRRITAASEFVTRAALDETNLTLYPPGTLVMAMYGEGRTRGKVARLGIQAATNQALAAIQLHDADESLRDFVQLFLEGRYAETRRDASGGVQPNLSLGIVRAIEVPLPPAEHRKAIVAEVDRRLSVVERLEAAIDENLARAKRLRQAILKRAFEGRLVPQDPNDEPASVLLERVRRERETSAAGGKPAARKKPKAAAK
jgi:type I restriction enzyme, S subunit